MKKLIFLFCITLFTNGLLFASYFHFKANSNSHLSKPEVISVLNQGDTILLFQVKTITTNGQYAPRHVLAIWITNENDQYITSLKVRAATYKTKLNKWKTYSGGVIPADAISGASLTSHQTHTVAWNGKNTSGSVVPNGNYRVYVEFNETNNTSGNPFTYVTFTKGDANQHLTPANVTNFQNMDLQFFAPTNIHIPEMNSIADFSVFPNPVMDCAKISLNLESSATVCVDIYSVLGKRVHTIKTAVYSEGQHTFLWYPSDSAVKSGTYFVKLCVGKSVLVKKIIVK